MESKSDFLNMWQANSSFCCGGIKTYNFFFFLISISSPFPHTDIPKELERGRETK